MNNLFTLQSSVAEMSYGNLLIENLSAVDPEGVSLSIMHHVPKYTLPQRP